MFTKFLLLFFGLQSSTAAILNLNDSDYALIPPLFHLDNYEECFDSPEAIYCSADISLVSDEPSKLLTMIQEYSAYPLHFNHTLLRHGYCMNKTCKKFFNVSAGDLRLSLEACLNESLYDQYKLKAIVLNNTDCSKRDREQPIDNLDISVGVICLVILLANLVGSLCDRFLDKGRAPGGFRFLYCFSIFRNWKKFVEDPRDSSDSRLQALKGIHGIRALSMATIISAHAVVFSISFIVNPEVVEAIQDMKSAHIFTNGSLVIQTFLVMSSFLLVYNWLIDLEKDALSWIELPKRILMRWLRLTPSYALALGITATWFGRMASGPNFKRTMYREISDCRRVWWKHLLYINNYSDEGSNCMIHTWYLAADTQLYCLGVVIFLMCRTGLTRKVVLSLLFVAGMIFPTLHIYYQHVHGALLASPESPLDFFENDSTFHNVYIKGHTNLTGFVIGMALGYIIYSWQKAGGNFNKIRKYRYLYWTLFFWLLLCSYSGSVYYYSAEPVPLYVELLIALVKPMYGVIIAIIMAGIIIQFEGLYRPILEWHPFVYLSRLSYSSYLLHFLFVKAVAVSFKTTQRLSILETLPKFFTMLTSSFIAAFVFTLLVETPSSNLVGELFRKRNKHTKEDNEEAVEEYKRTEDDKTTDLSQTIIEDGAIVIKMGTTKQFS